MNATVFSLLFVVVVLAGIGLQIWLTLRHIRHVQTHRTTVPPAFAAQIALAQHQKAADYTMARTRLGMMGLLVSAALLLVWTLGGGLEVLDSAWRAASLSPVWTGTLLILSFAFIGTVLDLPLQIVLTFGLEQRFGFNRTSAATFWSDLAKQFVLFLLIGTPLVLLILWLMEVLGERWWLAVWGVWTAFSVLMVWAYPSLIAPLFNRFEPLTDTHLKERIEDLFQRTGFRARGLFVMDGSKRSGHSNAYFTGLGNSKRVVLYDTLIKSLNTDELEAVLAHELGHFRRRHVTKRMAWMSALTLGGLALLGWLIDQPWFYAGLGITRPSNYTALLLFLLAGPVFVFFLQPLVSWASRKQEYEADVFAAQHSSADHMCSALVKLYQENASTLTPDPLHSKFYDSHPPAPLRIAHLQSTT